MDERDEYRKYMDLFEIRLMPESYRGINYARPDTEPLGDDAVIRVARDSFAQLNFAVTVPGKTIILTEQRPAFMAKLPVDSVGILRVASDFGGFSGRVFNVENVTDDDDTHKADVLTPEQVYVKAWKTAQITLLADIPADTKPGDYTVTVRFYSHSMFYDERIAKEVKVTLRVAQAVIPRGDARRFHLNLWQHVFNIARKSEVAAYSDEHIEALRPYCKALCELGCQYATVLLSDVPWAGQMAYADMDNPSDLYEYNFVRVHRNAEGRFYCDFSFAESYIALMREYGAKKIMFSGLHGIWMNEGYGFGKIVEDWPDFIRVSYTDDRDGCIRFMRTKAEIEEYFALVYKWICETGRLGCSVLMGDEVNLGNVGEWMGMLESLHRIMPDIRMEWDCEPSCMLSEGYADEKVDVYTPGHDAWMKATEEQRRAMLARIPEDGSIMWSTCCYPPLLNSFVRDKLTEVRLHGLIAEFMKVDGFLRWNFTVWPEDPRGFLPVNDWGAGDTCFVYPGKGGQCLLSLRYLALRRGIEDYELCKLVREKRADADKIIEKVMDCVLFDKNMAGWDYETFEEAPRCAYYSADDADYQRARSILMDALEEDNK